MFWSISPGDMISLLRCGENRTNLHVRIRTPDGSPGVPASDARPDNCNLGIDDCGDPSACCEDSIAESTGQALDDDRLCGSIEANLLRAVQHAMKEEHLA